MTKFEVQVDDEVLTEAKNVLHSLGMDVNSAINIYLRRIALEKGLPMAMAGINAKQIESDDNPELQGVENEAIELGVRTNNKITSTMVDEVWKAFMRFYKDSAEIKPLSIEVTQSTGMNQGSAFIYLTVLSNLVEGESNKRLLKYTDLVYLMSKIKSDLGEQTYQKALKSLIKSVPYWREKIPGSFADKVEDYYKKYASK